MDGHYSQVITVCGPMSRMEPGINGKAGRVSSRAAAVRRSSSLEGEQPLQVLRD